MTYKVILAENKQELEYLVNKAISEGWIPQGGVFVRSFDITGNTYFHLYQAMVKEAGRVVV